MEQRIRTLLAIEETALLLAMHTTGAERAEHRARAQAAYDDRRDLVEIKARAEQAETLENANGGMRP